MKVVDTTPKPWREELRVSALSIDSRQFFEFLERHSRSDDEVSLSYKSGANESTQLENLAEIHENLASIRVPFTVELPDFEISFVKDNGATFTFQSKNRKSAENAFLELRQFKIWYSFIKHWTIYLISIFAMIITGYSDYTKNFLIGIGFSEKIASTSEGIIALISIFVIVLNLAFLRYSVIYRHKVIDGFISRNRDQIIVALIAAFAGALVTMLVTNYFSTSSSLQQP